MDSPRTLVYKNCWICTSIRNDGTSFYCGNPKGMLYNSPKLESQWWILQTFRCKKFKLGQFFGDEMICRKEEFLENTTSEPVN